MKSAGEANVSKALSFLTWASSGSTPCSVSGRCCVLNSQQSQTFLGLFLLELAHSVMVRGGLQLIHLLIPWIKLT